jgi:hypothetical protein
MKVQIVATTYIHQIWDKVEPYFEAAELEGTGDCTTCQLKLQIVSGSVSLLVAVDDDGVIQGAAALSVQNQPNHRVAVITAMGGKGIVDAEVFEQVVVWAKSQGATKIRAWAKDSQARLYRQKAGLITTMNVVEKLI